MVLLFILFLTFLTTLSIFKSIGLDFPFLEYVGGIPYHDKLGHFLLMGILAYLLLAGLLPKLIHKYTYAKSVIFIVTSLTIIIGLDEYSQHFISSRSCCWGDFLFGLLGLILATLIYMKKVRMLR